VAGIKLNRPRLSLTYGVLAAVLALFADWVGGIAEEVLRPPEYLTGGKTTTLCLADPPRGAFQMFLGGSPRITEERNVCVPIFIGSPH
jgi:hypothetical protein